MIAKEFIEELKTKETKEVTYLYDIIYDLLVARKVELIDEIILLFIDDYFSFKTSLAFLMICSSYKKYLNNWIMLLNNTEKIGYNECGIEDTDDVLKNFKQ